MTQSLTIAKAALSASLFRADPVSLPRATVDALFPLLHSTLTQCSRPNVQNSKVWIVEHVAPSRSRTAALGKYLVALSKSLEHDNDGKKPSLNRRRLHVLYIVSDVLHHVTTKLSDGGFADAIGEHLPALVACAADFENCPKQMRKLQDLVGIWEKKRFFSGSTLAKLQAALSGNTTDAPGEPQPSNERKPAKDAPFTLPSFHGDQSTPWYDLPAGTWLPHLTPNSTKPMIPSMVKPIQLAPGPADEDLSDAVSKLLTDVERMFSKAPKIEIEDKTDINELGERVFLDEITGDILGGETYYGWSRAFCEKMKERKLKVNRVQDRGRSRSRSSDDYSRGRSRSSSGPPAFKRRRPSSSSRSPRRRSNRPRSYSSRKDSRSRSHSRSRSRSRSRSPYVRRDHTRSPSRSPRQDYRDYPPTFQHRAQQPTPHHQPPPPNPSFQPRAQQQPPQYQPPPLYSQGSFAPLPPPPAPGYQQGWHPPPPPPPPPPHIPNMPPIPVAGQWTGGWGPGAHAPPPPPPPPQQQYGGPPSYQNEQMGGGYRGRGGNWGGGHRGRGGGGFRGRGRGWQ